MGNGLDVTGFSLTIDDKFSQKLEEADKKIKKLADTSEETQKRINAAFKSMADDGVEAFLKKLREAEAEIEKLGKKNIKVNLDMSTSGNGNIASQLDALTQLAQGYNNLAQAKQMSKYAEEEAAMVASNAHKQRMAELSTEAQQVQINATNEKAQLQYENNLAIEQLNQQKEAKRQLSLQDKQSVQDARVAAAQMKTEANELIAQEKEKQIEIKRTIAEYQRLAKAYRAATTTLSRDNIDALMTQSSEAVTINQRIVAINNLKNALRDIDTTSANYKETQKELAVEIGRQRKELLKLGVDVDETNRKKRNLGNTADQLARKLALVFSVSAISGYIRKMVQVRAEFELQQKALSVILQSKNEANKLWNQVVQLAVKSPFTIQELHGYVKELSAYRIETDQLFDTTKRLADVSAGLGVDMGRLILAYGQVRAAEYLRGTELRQFTEAGIPMLQELADRFTALEGRAVSTADVFERISKRMVTFKDVAAVFRSMTDEGGTFYKMQEEQAQTLAGQISNLKDEMSIMLNDIGKESQGILMLLIQLAKFMVRNWRAIAPVLKTGIGLLVVYKTALFTLSGTARQAAISLGYVKAGTLGLTGAIKKLFWVLKSNPWGAILSALAMAALALADLFSGGTDDVKELDKALQETQRTISNIKFKFENANDIQTQREQLLALSKLAEKQYGIKLNIDWEAKTPEELKAEFEKAVTEMQQFSSLFNRTVNLFEGDKDERAKDNQNLTNFLEERKALYETYMASVLEEAESKYEYMDARTKIAFQKTKSLWIQASKDPDLLFEKMPILISYVDELALSLQHSALNSTKQGDGLKYLLTEMRGGISLADSSYSTYSKLVEKTRENYEEGIKALKMEADKIKDKKVRTEFVMKFVDAYTSYESLSDWERANLIRRISGQIDFYVNLRPVRPQEEALQAWQKEFNRLFSSNMVDTSANLPALSNAQETQSEVIKKLSSSLGELKTQIEQVKNGANDAYGGAVGRQKQISILRNQIDATTRAIKWLGGAIKDTSKKAGSTKDWYTELANALKNAHKEFQTLNKDLSASAAKTLMLERHTEVLNDIISNLKLGGKFDWKAFDLTTEEGIIQALEKLKNITPSVNKTALLNIKKALSDIRGEVQIDIAKESLDRAKKQMDSLFTNYKLFIELDDMGVPQDWAKTMFGLDTTSLSDIKNKLEDLKMMGRFDSENGQKQYKDYLQKIAEMEDEERLASMKKYMEYLLKSTSARVQAQLDGQKKINEINKTFRITDEQATKNLGIGEYAWDAIKSKVDDLTTSIQNVTEAEVLFFKAAGLSDEQIKMLSEYIKLMNNAKQRAIIGVENDTQKATDKAVWEDFKNTDLYIEMFEDLDSVSTKTLEAMKVKLEEMRNSLKGLDPSELKEIAKKINDVNKALVENNPFKGLLGSFGKGIKALKEYKKASENALNAQEEVESQKKIVDNLTLQVKEQQDLVSSKKNSAKASDEEIAQEESKLNNLDYELTIAKKNLEIKKQTADAAEEETNNAKQRLAIAREQLKQSASQINEGYSAFQGLTEEIQNVFGAFGDGTQDFLENVGAIVDGVTNVETGMSEILDGKVITGSLHVLTGAVKTIGGIFGLGTKDKRRERQIQKELSLVSDLQRAYEKLEAAIDEAYNIDTLQKSSDAARANLQQQIAAYQRMIAAEEDKKKTDKDKIKEWRNAIEDLQEQIKELNEQDFEKATDGIISNVLDASKEFTDAWLEAFEETGNGLSGLEENFAEAMKSMLKQQASLLISSKWVEKWKAELEKFINPQDMELSVGEAKAWAESVRNSLPGLSTALEDYFNAFKDAGIDLFGSGNLSGLQAGIQGITEEQADIRAAYLNSVRFYVANMDATLTQLATHIMGNTEVENPQVTQLKIIASQTTAINNLLSSLTAKHPTMAGYGLKVII